MRRAAALSKCCRSNILLSLHGLPSVHLECIMPLDTPHRLPQAPRPPVPVVRVGRPVLVEYDAVPRLRIFRVVDVPDMPGILRHDGHVIRIRADDRKIRTVQGLQLLRAKHPQSPFPCAPCRSSPAGRNKSSRGSP